MATTTRTRSKAKTTAKRKSTAKRKATAQRKTARSKTTAKRKTAGSKTAAKRKTPAKRKTAARGKATAKRKTATRRKAAASSGPDCPISKAEFRKAAERLHLQIGSWGDGAPKYDLDPREFSSGSFGWFASEKLDVPVGGKRVRCQMSLNVTVIGSKNSR